MFVIGRVEGFFNIYTSLGCAIGTMLGGKIGGTRRNMRGCLYENSVDLSRNGKRGRREEREKECYV